MRRTSASQREAAWPTVSMTTFRGVSVGQW